MRGKCSLCWWIEQARPVSNAGRRDHTQRLSTSCIARRLPSMEHLRSRHRPSGTCAAILMFLWAFRVCAQRCFHYCLGPSRTSVKHVARHLRCCPEKPRRFHRAFVNATMSSSSIVIATALANGRRREKIEARPKLDWLRATASTIYLSHLPWGAHM